MPTYVRNWYDKAQQNKQQTARAGEKLQERAAENAGSFGDRGSQYRPANRRHEGEGG